MNNTINGGGYSPVLVDEKPKESKAKKRWNKFRDIAIVKGGIAWKLPLFLFLSAYFSGNFSYLFLRHMFTFTLMRSNEPGLFPLDPTLTENKEIFSSFIMSYQRAFQDGYESYGIALIAIKIFELLLILLFAFYLDRFTSEEMGIKFSVKSAFVFLGGVLIAFSTVSVIIGVIYLNGNISFQGLKWVVSPDIFNISIFKFNAKNNMIGLVIFQAVLYMLVAFQEEIFARAYLINNVKWAGKKFAIIFATLTFAILHVSNLDYIDASKIIGLTNIGILAVIFSIYFYKYNDLWLLIGAHFGWNFFMGPFYGLTVSNVEQLNGKSILAARVSGSDYITGGGFGPEGSLITTVVLLGILSAAIIIGRRNKNKEIKAVEIQMSA